jgi:protoporphyrinogen IX oxidase
MLYLTLKSLHLIFIVTWFAALFYMPRLMVYASEIAKGDKTAAEREVLITHLQQWQRRLWLGIANPSAIITLVMGVGLIFIQYFPHLPDWLWVKLLLLTGLYTYHFATHRLYQQQAKGQFLYTGDQLRLWNEVPTLFLFGIIFQVIFKGTLGLTGLLLIIIFLLITIYIGFRVYRAYRRAER